MTQFAVFIVFLCFFAVNTIRTQALELGRCPYVRARADFNVSQALGRWYDYASYPTNDAYRCITNDIGLIQNDVISIYKSLIGKTTGLQIGVTGKAVVSGPGTLNISTNGIAGIFTTDKLTVLDIDSNYAVLYNCVQKLLLFHEKYFLILTRESQPSEEVVNNAENALRNNGLSVEKLVLKDQLNCPPNH